MSDSKEFTMEEVTQKINEMVDRINDQSHKINVLNRRLFDAEVQISKLSKETRR